MSPTAVSILLAGLLVGLPPRAIGAAGDVPEDEQQKIEPSARSSEATLSLATKVMDAAAVIADSGSGPAAGSLPATRLAFREESGTIVGSFSLEVSADSLERLLEGIDRAGSAVPELRIQTLRVRSPRRDERFHADLTATVAEAPSSPAGVAVRAVSAIERAWRGAALELERIDVKRAGSIWEVSGGAREEVDADAATDRESWRAAVTAAATVFDEVAIESIRITESRATRDGGKERFLGFQLRAAKPRPPADDEGSDRPEEK